MKSKLTTAINATVLLLTLSAGPEATAQVPPAGDNSLPAVAAPVAVEIPQSLAARAVRRPSLRVFRTSCDSFDWTVAGNGFSYSESIYSVKQNSLGQAVLIRGTRRFFGDARTYGFSIRLSWDTFGCIRTGRLTAGGKSVRF